MVVRVVRERVCDICESNEGVCRYRITKIEGNGQRTSTVDLCEEHGGTVEDAMSAAPTPRRGSKATRPVVSLDDINTKKRVAKKAPAKKPGPSRKR